MPDHQDNFSRALLDPDLPVPDGVIRPDGTPAQKRFDVYRNNVVVSLSEALADAFPVIKSLVGEKFFAAMAGVYVRQSPPRSPLIMFYGADFADFLEGFEPVATLPYLPDVARLEHARRLAYHAADDPIADLSLLADMNETTLLGLRFRFQAATRIVPSAHPVFSIWRYNSTEDKSPIPDTGEDVLITRSTDMVEMRTLPPGGAAFLQALVAGATLGSAAQDAANATATFDLGANLSGLFSAGIIAEIQKTNKDEEQP